jgi:hypothetical protein
MRMGDYLIREAPRIYTHKKFKKSASTGLDLPGPGGGYTTAGRLGLQQDYPSPTPALVCQQRQRRRSRASSLRKPYQTHPLLPDLNPITPPYIKEETIERTTHEPFGVLSHPGGKVESWDCRAHPPVDERVRAPLPGDVGVRSAVGPGDVRIKAPPPGAMPHIVQLPIAITPQSHQPDYSSSNSCSRIPHLIAKETDAYLLSGPLKLAIPGVFETINLQFPAAQAQNYFSTSVLDVPASVDNLAVHAGVPSEPGGASNTLEDLQPLDLSNKRRRDEKCVPTVPGPSQSPELSQPQRKKGKRSDSAEHKKGQHIKIEELVPPELLNILELSELEQLKYIKTRDLNARFKKANLSSQEMKNVKSARRCIKNRGYSSVKRLQTEESQEYMKAEIQEMTKAIQIYDATTRNKREEQDTTSEILQQLLARGVEHVWSEEFGWRERRKLEARGPS